MSLEGIQLATNVIKYMEDVRKSLEVLGNCGELVGTKAGTQDMRLAEMIADGKNVMKHQFTRIAKEKIS